MRDYLFCLIVIVLLAMPASAGDRGFYVGGGLGLPSFDEADFNPEYGTLRYQEESFGFKVFGGYQIIKFLAVEAGHTDYGNVMKRETTAWLVHKRMNVGIHTWDASVVGLLPLGPKVGLFGKVGVASWNADVRVGTTNETEDQSRDGTDMTYGLGVDILFKKLGVRFEGDWLMIPDTNGAFMISVNLTYHF